MDTDILQRMEALEQCQKALSTKVLENVDYELLDLVEKFESKLNVLRGSLEEMSQQTRQSRLFLQDQLNSVHKECTEHEKEIERIDDKVDTMNIKLKTADEQFQANTNDTKVQFEHLSSVEKKFDALNKEVQDMKVSYKKQITYLIKKISRLGGELALLKENNCPSENVEGFTEVVNQVDDAVPQIGDQDQSFALEDIHHNETADSSPIGAAEKSVIESLDAKNKARKKLATLQDEQIKEEDKTIPSGQAGECKTSTETNTGTTETNFDCDGTTRKINPSGQSEESRPPSSKDAVVGSDRAEAINSLIKKWTVKKANLKLNAAKQEAVKFTTCANKENCKKIKARPGTQEKKKVQCNVPQNPALSTVRLNLNAREFSPQERQAKLNIEAPEFCPSRVDDTNNKERTNLNTNAPEFVPMTVLMPATQQLYVAPSASVSNFLVHGQRVVEAIYVTTLP